MRDGMGRLSWGVASALGAAVLCPGVPIAATQTILAGRFDVANPRDDDPSRRRIVAAAGTTEGPKGADAVHGNPARLGATLRVIARGKRVEYDETFALPAAGWREFLTRHDWPVYKVFSYSNARTGGPVQELIVKSSGWASPEGAPPPETPAPGYFRFKVLLQGRHGPIGVLPPDPGIAGGMVLSLGGGDTYCFAFGGDAGGSIRVNTARRFLITRPVRAGCPVDPPVETTTTTTTAAPVASTTTGTAP
jgi:hypothetical protein